MIFEQSKKYLNVRQYKYLRIMYYTALIVFAIEIYKYNFKLNFSSLNDFWAFCYLLILFSPVITRFVQGVYFIFAFTFFPSMLIMTSMLSVSGGFYAPGIYWIVAVPMTMGFLFGRKGTQASIWITAVVLGFVGLSQYFGDFPNVLASQEYFRIDQLSSFFTFLIYTFANVFYFIEVDENADNKVGEHKEFADSLLRVLVHDVVTPLTTLNLESKILKEKFQNLDVDYTGHWEKWSRSLEQVNGMIRQARFMRKLKEEGDQLQLQSTPILKVVRELSGYLMESSLRNQTILNLDIPSNEILVPGDSQKMKEWVLLPLLTHAFERSVDAHWIDLRISIVKEGDSKSLLLELFDFGVPPNTELLQTLFDKPVEELHLSGERDENFIYPLMKKYLEAIDAEIDIKSHVEILGKTGNVTAIRFKKFR